MYSSAHRPSYKESTHLHSDFGPWFSQVPAFFPWGRSLKSNALCVWSLFPGFCGCSWKLCSGKQTCFGCFMTFGFVWEIRATHLDKMMNDIIQNKTLIGLRVSGGVELFFLHVFRKRATKLQVDRRLSVGCKLTEGSVLIAYGFFGLILWTYLVNHTVSPVVNTSEGSRNLHYTVLCIGKQLYSWLLGEPA